VQERCCYHWSRLFWAVSANQLGRFSRCAVVLIALFHDCFGISKEHVS
jgi:hypothetical protein